MTDSNEGATKPSAEPAPRAQKGHEARKPRSRLVESLALLLRGIVRAAITVLLVWAVLSVAVRVYVERVWEAVDHLDQVRTPQSALERLETLQHMERIEAALEVYRLRNDRYPPNLEALVEEGLLAQRALRFPSYEEVYFYRPTADNFILHPPLR